DHLIQVWSEGTAATRLEYVNKVAVEIFRAAKKFCESKPGDDGEAGTPGASVATKIPPRGKKKDVEQFVTSRKYQHDPCDLVDPRAEPRLISREVVAPDSDEKRQNGVPI